MLKVKLKNKFSIHFSYFINTWKILLDPSGWWQGKNSAGKIGIFPGSSISSPEKNPSTHNRERSLSTVERPKTKFHDTKINDRKYSLAGNFSSFGSAFDTQIHGMKIQIIVKKFKKDLDKKLLNIGYGLHLKFK